MFVEFTETLLVELPELRAEFPRNTEEELTETLVVELPMERVSLLTETLAPTVRLVTLEIATLPPAACTTICGPEELPVERVRSVAPLAVVTRAVESCEMRSLHTVLWHVCHRRPWLLLWCRKYLYESSTHSSIACFLSGAL